MINVSVREVDFMELKEEGYELEHNNNMLTIRNFFRHPIVEIIYFEETNEILVSTQEEFIWCRSVYTIRCSEGDAIVVGYIVDEGHKGRIIAEDL